MASIGIIEIIAAIISLGLIYHFSLRKSAKPWSWPVLGMLPMLLFNWGRLFDTINQLVDLNNGTFLLKGAWFSSRDMIVTSNPANVLHIMSANFSNYPKGAESKRIFDVFGDMLFNSDLDEWRKDRKIAHAYFNDKRFHQFWPKVTQNTLQKGLFPVLQQASKKGEIIDLQDVIQRFMFDTSCMIITGFDPASLRVGFPEIAFSTAMDVASRVILLRHILPGRIWSLQRKLGLGEEGKMSKVIKTLDQIADKYITMRQEELRKDDEDLEIERFDILRCFITMDEIFGPSPHPYGRMRDAIIGLMFAGRDTTSVTLTWLFWLISENPNVENKIREELKANFPSNHEAENASYYNDTEVLKKLVYLHGALCESLRLYPPISLQRRVVVRPDILPSGHHVDPSTKVVICLYAMGRMKFIWGEDCYEFKPERWITAKGGTKVVASNKFQAFSSGPRVCPGRELAFGQLKSVAAAIIHNYHVQVVKSGPAVPESSIAVHMKDGLKVKLTKIRD